MTPTNFTGQNIIFAEDQPEYQALPAFHDDNGTVLTCWKISRYERLKILLTGRIYIQVLTFNHPLQPILPSIENPLKFQQEP